MPAKSRKRENSTAVLATALTRMRMLSKLTQAEIARRMGTTQTAIARLERGTQSPSMRTLQSFARAAGFCLEIGFLRSGEAEVKTGCVILIDNAESGGHGESAASA